MNLLDIATKARDLVGASSTTYPNANLLIDINLWYQKAVTMILDSQDDSDFDDSNNSTYPEYTWLLQDLVRDYSIPPTLNILQIKRLDISYDGVTWNRCNSFDDSMEKRGMPPVTGYPAADAVVDARYVRQSPEFDYKYGTVFLYPRPQTGDALAGAKARAEFTRAVVPFSLSDLTTGTAVPGFDIPFHPILAYGPAMEFAQKKALPQLTSIMTQLQDYEARLKRSYGNKDRDLKLTLMPYDVPEDSYNR